MDKYLELLMEQYKQATGTVNIDIHSKAFASEFTHWISTREKCIDNYLELLEYMKLYNYVDSDTIEIGKGCFDSVVKPFNTTIVTPHCLGLKNRPNKQIIDADFKVYSSGPALIRDNKDGSKKVIPFDSDIFITFMTQNPYYISLLKNWDQLHNSGNSGIIVGVYGSINDKDISRKIESLRLLRDRLDGHYLEEYTVINDSYYYAVATNRLSKVKVKEKKFGAIR